MSRFSKSLARPTERVHGLRTVDLLYEQQCWQSPMYLGLVTLSLGIAVWIGAWPMFIAPPAVFATVNWVHIPFEEAKMGRQFGASYDDYVTRVRRWA
jgi:protein-S-isoprenylcysteine O-methyltransferase Ste14